MRKKTLQQEKTQKAILYEKVQNIFIEEIVDNFKTWKEVVDKINNELSLKKEIQFNDFYKEFMNTIKAEIQKTSNNDVEFIINSNKVSTNISQESDIGSLIIEMENGINSALKQSYFEIILDNAIIKTISNRYTKFLKAKNSKIVKLDQIVTRNLADLFRTSI